MADGAGLVVSTAAGRITLPVVIDELPDFVVWLPANSQSSTVYESLRVGSGAVVTRDVPERGIVAGNPARLRGFACDCGHPLGAAKGAAGTSATLTCSSCGRTSDVPSKVYARLETEAVR